MTADEIMQMKDTDEIILLEAQSPVKAKKCYWFKESRYRKLLNKETYGTRYVMLWYICHFDFICDALHHK